MMVPEREEAIPTRPQGQTSFVVGVGASAGGLDPLEKFFSAIPANTGACFVVVQHLSPDFKSLMKELLNRRTKLPVHSVEDGMALLPDSIFLIPPKKTLELKGGLLRLHDRDASGGRSANYPIDIFFESLAREVGPRAIGVVLSGTGADGSRGVRFINEAGGLVLAQDVETAQFDGMPRNAVATGSVHGVYPPDELATAVCNYVRWLDQPSDPLLVPGAEDKGMLSEIIAVLRSDTGVDFSHYRVTTVARRVSRRVSMSGEASLEDYVRTLHRSPEERASLRSDLLIGVTAFFRDSLVWRRLADECLVPMVAAKGDGDIIRVWISACSTGEEVYSLAILISECLASLEKRLDVKVFATDIDKKALDRATIGVYPPHIAEDVGRERLSRYFEVDGDGYRISRKLREMVIFAEHDLGRDAPFTHMDVVTCRNALIYMNNSLQSRVLSTLHFALRPGGYLVLGAAESLGDLAEEFAPVDAKWKIFRKLRDVVLRPDGRRPILRVLTPVTRPLTGGRASPVNRETLGRDETLTIAFSLLTKQMSAACLLVDNQNRVIHTFGAVGRYLQVPEGENTSDVSRMVGNHLSSYVSSALRRARETRGEMHFVEVPADPRKVSVGAIWQCNDAAGEFGIVLLRADGGERGDDVVMSGADALAEARIEDLQSELLEVRENLQATIEELETTNEEHQATNEELLAANEQLQSTNEELQSVNEELYTVNSEHQNKIQELTELNDDIDNLMLTTGIATLFLDTYLQIRKVTSAVKEIINVGVQDIGRSIEHFSHNTDHPDLFGELGALAADGGERERVVRTKSKVYLMRAITYTNTGGNQGDGIIVSFLPLEHLRPFVKELDE